MRGLSEDSEGPQNMRGLSENNSNNNQPVCRRNEGSEGSEGSVGEMRGCRRNEGSERVCRRNRRNEGSEGSVGEMKGLWKGALFILSS